MADHPALQPNPPWLFGFLSIPNGLSSAIIVILMSYALRKQGVAVDHIAEVVALASIPNVWYFLYSSVVISGCGAALHSCSPLPRTSVCRAGRVVLGGSLAVATILLFASGTIGSLVSSAHGALLSILDPRVGGRDSGWYQAGNLRAAGPSAAGWPSGG